MPPIHPGRFKLLMSPNKPDLMDASILRGAGAVGAETGAEVECTRCG